MLVKTSRTFFVYGTLYHPGDVFVFDLKQGNVLPDFLEDMAPAPVDPEPAPEGGV